MRAGKGAGVSMNNWMHAEISSYPSQGSLCPLPNPTLSLLAAILPCLLFDHHLPPSSSAWSLLNSASSAAQNKEAVVARVEYESHSHWVASNAKDRMEREEFKSQRKCPFSAYGRFKLLNQHGPPKGFRVSATVLRVGNTNYWRHESECGSRREGGMADLTPNLTPLMVHKGSEVWKQHKVALKTGQRMPLY